MPDTLLLAGDCLVRMRALPAGSIDAVVCDPPYELGFMGKSWDSSGIAFDPATWREALRVLKPGGYLLAFGGTRTYHRIAVAIEDAGFEIRDSLIWNYGSGFPKSLDVSKAIDKIDRSEASEARARTFTAWMRSTGITAQQVNDATGTCMGSHYLTDKSQPAVATADLFDLLRPLLPPVPVEIEALVQSRTVESENMKRRAVVGSKSGLAGSGFGNVGHGLKSTAIDITEPHTDAAKRWEGWGTALKPAFEPVVVARKPLIGTVAANVLKHGTGALNIDACRVATSDDVTTHSRGQGYTGPAFGHMNPLPMRRQPGQEIGRWPANVIFTHAPECGETCAPGCPVAARDAQSGTLTSGTGAVKRITATDREGQTGAAYGAESRTEGTPMVSYGDTGGASRFFTVTEYGEDDLPGVPFFYNAKASRSEREAGLHAGNMLCACEATRTEWENEDRKANTQAATGAFPPKATTESMPGGGSAWPTMSNGSATTEPSRPASMSTTSTRTSSTIASKTSPLNPKPTTNASIPGASYGTACGGNLAESAESESPSTSDTSTCPPKATPFTVDAAPATSERSSPQNKTAVRVCPRCGKRDRKPGAGDATDRNEGSAGLNSPRTGAGRSAKDGVWCSHPTVKPVAIMRWLVRLVTPPGGVVLDPFLGSGTTGIAAVREGFSFIGIEREAAYLDIARARIAHAKATP